MAADRLPDVHQDHAATFGAAAVDASGAAIAAVATAVASTYPTAAVAAAAAVFALRRCA